MKWGLIPSWSSSPLSSSFTQAYKYINARVESINSNSYTRLLSKRRCAVCLDGFFEWKNMKNGEKRPQFIYRKTDKTRGEKEITSNKWNEKEEIASKEKATSEQTQAKSSELPLSSDSSLFPASPFDGCPVLYLAALWDCWRDPHTHHCVYSVTILTTEPTQEFSSIHDRMPVVLSDELRLETWINCSKYSFNDCFTLLSPYRDNGLAYFPVSNIVNNIKNKGIECIKPYEIVQQERKDKGIMGFFSGKMGKNSKQIEQKEKQEEMLREENHKGDYSVKTENDQNEKVEQAISIDLNKEKSQVKREIDLSENSPELVDLTDDSLSVARSPVKSSGKLAKSPSKKRIPLLPGQSTLSFGVQANKKSKLN